MIASCLYVTCNAFLLDASVVSSNSHSATSAIIGGTMGAVILLLLIIVVLCAVVLCVNRTRNASPTDHYSPSYDDTLNYGLYSTIKPIELDVITTNRSYNIPTKPHSKSNEDEYTYVQPDHCIRPSDLEDDVKMDANPSYGVSTVEDRVTGFKTTAADTDTRPHHSPQQDDYDDVIAITNNDGIEENNAQIHTIVNQKYNTNSSCYIYTLLPITNIVVNQLVKVKMVLMINHKMMVLNNRVMEFGIQMFNYVYASMHTMCMDTLFCVVIIESCVHFCVNAVFKNIIIPSAAKYLGCKY